MATLHLLDCAYLLTAGGLPGQVRGGCGHRCRISRGCPCGILEPNFDLTLLDSLGKRVDFLRETADALGLRRVRCVHARAEEFAAEAPGAVSTSPRPGRWPNLNVLCELTLPLVKVGGVFLAMKSVEQRPGDATRPAAPSPSWADAVEDVTDYTIPGTEVTHRVVRIRKERPTPAGFPRAFARIKKAPLR